MDNGSLSSLDFWFLARELNARLKGGTIRKVYQYGRKSLRFDIYVPGSGELPLYSDSKRMYLGSEKKEAPEEPPSFCMLLRKYYVGEVIKDVRQHGFDKIIEIETADSILIFEFLPPGNVIFCDKFYNIMMPLENQKWKHREIRAKVGYVFPPEQHDIMKMEIWDFFTLISESEKSTSEALANLGLGAVYAFEVCKRSGINFEKSANLLTVDEATKLFNSLKEIETSPSQPCIYSDGVAPFILQTKHGSFKPVSEFSEALAAFFAGVEEEEEEMAVEEAAQQAIEKVERIEKQREEMVGMLKEKQEVKVSSAQLIYKHYDKVQTIMEGITKAHEAGMGWDEIKKRVAADTSEHAKLIKEIRESEGKVIVTLDGSDVELDITKEPGANAGALYDGAKKIKRKLSHMEKLTAPKPMSVEEIQQTLTGKKLREKKTRVPKSGKKRWYETYRWFISSEGNVVIAGKSAISNESVVKTRAKSGDAVFHAEIKGAAFVVAKADEKGTVGPLTIKEAVEFAAAHSKAWSQNMVEVDVGQFRPEDLSKTTPEGGKLPKGTFHVSKVTQNHPRTEVKMVIGVSVEGESARIFSGPLMPVRKSCKYIVTVRPGSEPSNQLAKKVKNAILAKCAPEDRRAIEALPDGEFQDRIPGETGSLVN